MIKITKEEAKLVRKYYPNVKISKTVNKYYMEENRRALQLIKESREGSVV